MERRRSSGTAGSESDFGSGKKCCYTKIEWEESYRDSVRHFLDVTLPALAALGEPDDVRLVFWFDN